MDIPNPSQSFFAVITETSLRRSSIMLARPEGHPCKIDYWYIPTAKFTSMIDRNVRLAFKDANEKYFMCIMDSQLHIVHTQNTDFDGVEISFADISCFKDCPTTVNAATKYIAVRLNEKCDKSCTRAKIEKYIDDSSMVCLPKLFYSVLPGYRSQPHKGGEYGDVSGEVSVGSSYFEMEGNYQKECKNRWTYYFRTERSEVICAMFCGCRRLRRRAKRLKSKVLFPNIKFGNNTTRTGDDLVEAYLLSTAKEGEEIIRQFVEQGMTDSRCQLIAVIAPQYFDQSFKGTLRYLARLAKKK